MDKELLKVNGVLRIKNPLDGMGKDERTKLIDEIAGGRSGRYLNVDFDFSHSGKKINRRIYSKKGQRTVAATLVDKAVNLDHSESVEKIIGRITSATYTDLVQDAKAFARKARIKEEKIDDLNQALETLDYQKIADLYHSTKVLQLRGWKGLGKVAAKARITDSESIVKFLDRRYLNFSAEQMPAQRICSICVKDMLGSECDHVAGMRYDDKLAFMICGDMEGSGAGVVMNGADPDAIVNSLTLTDSEDDGYELESTSVIDALVSIDREIEPESKVFTLGGSIEELENMIEDKTDEASEADEASAVVDEKPADPIAEAAPVVDTVLTDELNKKLSDALATVEKLNDSLSLKDKEIFVLNEKLATQASDHEKELTDAKQVSTSAVESFRKNHGRVLDLAKSLQAKEIKILDAIKPLLRILALEIEDEMSLDRAAEIFAKVDQTKLKNFMESGLQRDKVEPVENPVLDVPTETAPNEYHDNVRSKYKTKLEKDGKAVADAYLANLKNNRYLPKDFKI